MSWSVLALAVGGVLGGVQGGARVPASTAVPQQLRAYLDKYVHLTPREVDAIGHGEVIAKTIETNDRREIAAFGVTRIAAAPAPYLDGVRKLTWLRKSGVIAAAARFSVPPHLSDVADLVVDAQDIAALRSCRVGDCDVRLSAAAIRRFQNAVDWRSPDAGSRAASAFKEVLVQHVSAYLQGGDPALPDFHDQDHPVRPADEVREILAHSPYLREFAPELHDHLRAFPSSGLAGGDNVLYWSKERLGVKPIISATHITILERPSEVGPTLIASKQIYASHYFDGSLGLSAIFDVSTANGHAFYLAYMNRTRTRSLDSAFRSLARGSVKRRARDGVERMLRGLKTTLEMKRP